MKTASIENPTVPENIAAIAREMLATANAFQSTSAAPGASQSFPSSLGAIAEAMQAMSASIHELAHDAVPAVIERQRHIDVPAHPTRNGGQLSHEREAGMAATMHDVAQEFSRCSRACARARETLTAALSLAPALAADSPARGKTFANEAAKQSGRHDRAVSQQPLEGRPR